MRATLPLGGLIIGVLACTELPSAAVAPVVPIGSAPTIASLRGTIDLDRGTLEFAPVIPAALPGFAPAIYGDQNVNVRLYNSPVVVDSSTSTWRWTATVGVRNMRSHPIGDEETSPTPTDTIGVFVFFVQEPVLGQPCGACFVRIANFHGMMTFDAPQRKYFHWAERINEMNSPMGDTTRGRHPWTFETSAGVRSFSFSVLVAAAWPAPHENRWRVEYTADALPNNSAPVWKFEGQGGNASVSGGTLSLRGNFSGLFYRRDPIAPAQSAYAHAVMRRSGSGGSAPDVGLILSDRAKLMGVGVANGVVGLISAAGTFLPGTTSPLANGTHELQLRKYAADSVVYFVDGVRRGAALYGSLSADTFTPALSSVSFGGLPTSAGSNSTWESVIYEIGVPSP
ncbi:MAG TPA: hypothetical protein VJ650_02010 [Gemmatimonadaceae bacterium]|nr:hypothetical protein [Gemmatimonadaceae bacterium]